MKSTAKQFRQVRVPGKPNEYRTCILLPCSGCGEPSVYFGGSTRLHACITCEQNREQIMEQHQVSQWDAHMGNYPTLEEAGAINAW